MNTRFTVFHQKNYLNEDFPAQSHFQVLNLSNLYYKNIQADNSLEKLDMGKLRLNLISQEQFLFYLLQNLQFFFFFLALWVEVELGLTDKIIFSLCNVLRISLSCGDQLSCSNYYMVTKLLDSSGLEAMDSEMNLPQL